MPRKLDDGRRRRQESPDSTEQGGRCKPTAVRPSKSNRNDLGGAS